jgi:hypothetical protein
MENLEEYFVVKAYTKKELRLLYGLPRDTFRKWLKALPGDSGSGRNNWLTAAQVQAFIDRYGAPRLQQIKPLKV